MTTQLGLFHAPAPVAEPQACRLPGLLVRHWPAWAADADALLVALREGVPWKQDQITLFGRSHPLPRLTCWVGDPGCAYTYSGVTNQIEPWSKLLAGLRARVEAAAGCSFNSLLLNRYRNGRDSMGWHADDEPELDPEAPIASLSLGATRSFRLKPKPPAESEPLHYVLGHGDLLVMDPPTQQHWLHQVPQRLRVKEERINLTFRRVRRGMAG